MKLYDHHFMDLIAATRVSLLCMCFWSDVLGTGSQGELCGAEGEILKNIVQLKCTTWTMEQPRSTYDSSSQSGIFDINCGTVFC